MRNAAAVIFAKRVLFEDESRWSCLGDYVAALREAM